MLHTLQQAQSTSADALAAALGASVVGARRVLTPHIAASVARMHVALRLLIAHATRVFVQPHNSHNDNDAEQSADNGSGDDDDDDECFPPASLLAELRASYDAAPATVTLSLRNFTKAGRLSLQRVKKSGAKSWQKRYCVIKSHYLFIFKNEGDETPIGIANLAGPAFQVAHVRYFVFC